MAIPRFWNQLYSSYENEVKSICKDIKSEEEKKVIREETLKKYSQSLGPRLREIVTGGAPTAPDVFKFIQKCFSNTSVSNGYGATEVGG